MASIDSALPVRTISQDRLKQAIDRQADFTLIEVLDARQFDDFHLPGAVNIPLNDQFDDAVLAMIPDRNRKIVVYCSEASCDASALAVQKLQAMGYIKVRDFAGGKKAWREAIETPPAAPAAIP